MNRNTRTFIVVAIAIGVAGIASFWRIPRDPEPSPFARSKFAACYQVVAARDLDDGHDDHEGRRQARRRGRPAARLKRALRRSRASSIAV